MEYITAGEQPTPNMNPTNQPRGMLRKVMFRLPFYGIWCMSSDRTIQASPRNAQMSDLNQIRRMPRPQFVYAFARKLVSYPETFSLYCEYGERYAKPILWP